jgi:type IV pilus biogenesis protein CpaD/CtpE
VKKPILAVLAAALTATGCATGPDMSTDGAPRAEREYVTGSNIGRRKGEAPTDQIKTYSRETLENSYRTGVIGAGVTPSGGGGSAAGN